MDHTTKNPAAVLFDKDGTLVDLHRTWGAALGEAISKSARTPADEANACELMQYDAATQRMAMTSPFVAEPIDVIDDLLRPHLDLDVFAHTLRSVSASHVKAAAGADSLLVALEAAGVPCVVVTNDAEQTARVQMQTLGWDQRFDGFLGADSGFGGKPNPGIVEEGCRRVGAGPKACWMVGDSVHDILAGQRAGCQTLLVTNGGEPTVANEIADVVVASLEEVSLAMLSVDA